MSQASTGVRAKEEITQPRQEYMESFSRDLGLNSINNDGEVLHGLKRQHGEQFNTSTMFHVAFSSGITYEQVEMFVTLDFSKRTVSFFIPFEQPLSHTVLTKRTAYAILDDFIQRYRYIIQFAKQRLHNDEIFIYKSNGTWEYRHNKQRVYGNSLAECRRRCVSAR